MGSRTLLGVIILLGNLACGYHMHVYSEARGSVPPGASLFVTPNPQSTDAALLTTLTDRVAAILDEKGFEPATAESAQYHLFFDYVIEERSAGSIGWPLTDVTAEPPSMIRVEDPGGSYVVPRGRENTPVGTPDNNAPPTPAIPTPSLSDTVWVHYVTVQLVNAENAGDAYQLRPMWSGWAQWDRTLIDKPADRAGLLDALLKAAFQRFPDQTGGIIRVALRPERPPQTSD